VELHDPTARSKWIGYFGGTPKSRLYRGQESWITQDGGPLGTPAYMSPEQARGADIWPASDLYALGALGYFLLTGRPPFEGKNPLETLHAHMAQSVISPSAIIPSVPPDLAAVILKLLAKRPEDRYDSASQLDSALAICGTQGWSDVDAVAWWEAVSAPKAVSNT
jgi:serine/threonine protein kinase